MNKKILWKTIVITVIATVLLTGGLTGCGGSSSSSAQKEEPAKEETVKGEATPSATEAEKEEATPEATEEAAPEATEEATPEATEEAAPEATEEAAPEVTETTEPSEETETAVAENTTEEAAPSTYEGWAAYFKGGPSDKMYAVVNLLGNDALYQAEDHKDPAKDLTDYIKNYFDTDGMDGYEREPVKIHYMCPICGAWFDDEFEVGDTECTSVFCCNCEEPWVLGFTIDHTKLAAQ